MAKDQPKDGSATGTRVEAAFPLTPLQEGMLYHGLRTPSSGLYHGQTVARIEGPLLIEPFRRAWQAAARRHEAFRTLFAWKGRERPIQVVMSKVEIAFEILDWSGLSESERTERRRALADHDRRLGIAIGRAPMMRFTLVRLADETHEVLWSVHHAVMDGWSAQLVLDEVLDDYEAARGGQPVVEGPAPSSYARFVAWTQGRASDEVRDFWVKALDGVRAPTALPGPDGSATSTRRATADLWLSVDESDALRGAAARHRVTGNTLVIGAWAGLLARHEQRADVSLGMTLSDRPHTLPGVERSVGLYLSTVPVRVRLDGAAEVGSWLRDLQDDLTDARAHSGPSVADIQRWRGREGEELIRSLVVFESFPDGVGAPRPDRSIQLEAVQMSGPSDLPLALLAYPGERLHLQLVYDPALFSESRAIALLEGVRALLAAFTSRSGALSEIGLVPLASPTDVEAEYSAGPPLERPVLDVVELFEAEVRASPDALAIRTTSHRLSYRALDEAAEALADRLRALRLPRGSTVGLVGGRSPDAIAAMLGVLKAGCAYAPLDPTAPVGRLTQLATALDAVLVLDGYRDLIAEWPVPEIHEMDAAAADGSGAQVEGLAYVIHTSGSTGVPKGVMVSRDQLAWSTAARLDYYGDAPTVFLLLSSLAVDSSVAGVYGTLCSGGTLVLPDAGAEQDIAGLARWIETAGVTDTLLVPSLHRELLEAVVPTRLASLRRVVVAGEACPVDVVALHRARLPRVELHNEYGPSEATVWATVADLSTRPNEPVTIGRPVAGSRVYLVDSHFEPVPPGEVGEIVVGGPGVALGYLGRPDLTNERFLADPWLDGARVYRTGDRARRRADGRLEFLGRADDQIKIRGYRVEPAEVELALQAHPEVAEAMVGLDTSDERSGQLVAVVLPISNEATPDDLDGFLAARLPRHMIPSRFVRVERLPRTPAGKLDRSVPMPTGDPASAPTRPPADPPRTDAERALLEVWRGVLGHDDIGIHDDFFAIGGDSLLSIRAISRAMRAGVSVTPASFFAGPTIAQIAAAETAGPDRREAVVGEGHLTPIQAWFFERFGHEPHHWNQAYVVQLRQKVDRLVVERAVATLVEHHDALRQRFESTDDGWSPVFDEVGSSAPLHVVDLSGVSPDECEDRIEAVADDVHASLDIEKGRLFRAVLFEAGDGVQQLLLVAHHLVIDAVSWGILFDDLATLLERAAAGTPPALPGRTMSVQEWSKALRDAARGADVADLAPMWRAPLPDGANGVGCDLPASTADNVVATSRRVFVRLPSDVTDGILETARRSGGPSVQDQLLAGLLMAWERWAGRPHLLLDLEGHGRDTLGSEIDLSRTIGWFTQIVPVHLELKRATPEAALAAVRDGVPGSALRRASYGLLRYLHPEPTVRDVMRTRPEPEVAFNYLGSSEGLIPTGAPFVGSGRMVGAARSARAPRPYVLEINAWIEAGRATLAIEYSAALHRPDSIARFADALAEAIPTVAANGAESAFELAGLDDEGMDRLADLLSDLDAG